MKDKLNITIRIAHLPPIPLQIERNQEEIFRTAEYNVNKLWSSWCDRYPNKAKEEVLAMVTFQFAKYYYTLQHRENETMKALSDFESELDKILLDVQ